METVTFTVNKNPKSNNLDYGFIKTYDQIQSGFESQNGIAHFGNISDFKLIESINTSTGVVEIYDSGCKCIVIHKG